jgi:hypothetical protein
MAERREASHPDGEGEIDSTSSALFGHVVLLRIGRSPTLIFLGRLIPLICFKKPNSDAGRGHALE